MPKIREYADLFNNYEEISLYCHSYREPVFITKKGQGDLAVMGLETYEELMGRLELYQALQVGLEQIKQGEIITEENMMKSLNEYIEK
ncbi:MAG: type II toxin-antitoxin system prevent-host-death family antitoxin [Spirochaetales bacterium]|jgi:PHD/YefM family antitoxin component YafN of YafNO toxin-antitoxin module|nr:type II toxin-antitoxin system prevent-host-death family antitoxin [Spirochaetales bacterium]